MILLTLKKGGLHFGKIFESPFFTHQPQLMIPSQKEER